ncbi:uncharacterized protein LOC120627532 [Pararge aegeria]|uniref:Jg3895 protein n=1 Tax=Pararge aegeria aegeria TaxID=348720 RepID=A0A8S4RV78_9NEOP|nr:uncharacterized protein LOC120627532 [Pararge aegeria]CAH2241559.1 jg3895 [Pararge aegeria aegeria]
MFNMKLICAIFSVIFVVCASAELSKARNFDGKGQVIDVRNYDEIDPVVDMLLNNEYENPVEPTNNKVEEGVETELILYPDGVWKCGNCTNMKQMKLLYSEAYDHDTNYDEYAEELNMEIQIGLSLKNMRCITMEAEEDIDVRLVSGACAGEQATLGVMRATHCVVSVYG